MRDILIAILEIILISLMFIHPILSNYRRYLIGNSKILFTLQHNKFWTRDSALFAIFVSISAVFFIIVGIATMVKGNELPLHGWLFILGPIVFFGSLSFDSSHFRARTIFTENGIISPYGNYFWRTIKGYEWVPDFKQGYFLRIVIMRLPLNISLPIRGLTATSADKEVISKIFDDKLKGNPNS